jgi:hypothetical protein
MLGTRFKLRIFIAKPGPYWCIWDIIVSPWDGLVEI